MDEGSGSWADLGTQDSLVKLTVQLLMTLKRIIKRRKVRKKERNKERGGSSNKKMKPSEGL